MSIISEYSIKTLFGQSDIYKIQKESFNKSIYDPNVKFVVKVDCSVKSRKKNGLIKIGYLDEIEEFIANCEYDTFIMEKFYDIEREDYLMFRHSEIELSDEIYYGAGIGGVDFNDLSKCQKINIPIDGHYDDDSIFFNNEVIKKLFIFYRKYNFTYLEINPFCCIKESNKYIPLDFAGKFDDDSLFLFNKIEQELLTNKSKESNNIEIEKEIENLDEKSGSSLKFKLLNQNGSIWTMVAGGGASVLYTDCIVNMNLMDELANYGEYSGNPTKDELYKYSNLIIKQMLKSETNKKMYLIIGGGISNFTYIDETFKGISRTINEMGDLLSQKKICVLVRRGGLNYKEGLKIIENSCNNNNIECYTYGYDTHITSFLLNHIPHEKTICNEKEDMYNTDVENLIPNIKNNNLDFYLSGKIIIMNLQKDVIQRILDYDYMSGLLEPSVSCVYYIGDTKSIKVFWGTKEIFLPVYSKISDIINANLNITIALNYYSFRSAYEMSINIMEIPTIKNICIIAEGIPIRQTKLLNIISKKKNINILGCSTVGAIFPERRRFGNAMGSLEHIKNIHLYQKGSVGLVTKSGGLLNEIANMINLHSDGVNSAISVGGDRYPCTSLLDVVLAYEKNDEIKLIVVLGEVGSIQELELGVAKQKGLINKPIMCWCSGTSLDLINKTKQIKFGHAGSFIEEKYESAIFKNNYMKKSGIIVPDTFEQYQEIFINMSNNLNINNYIQKIIPKDIPSDFSELVKNKKIRIDSSFVSSISNERGELMYNGKNVSEHVKSNNKIGTTIGALLFKKDLPPYLSYFIELCIVLLADHGIAVSSSHNTAVAARAGQNISASVASGLLTVHEKHGGAMQDCAKEFYDAKYINSLTPDEFVKKMKNIGKVIPGIGHAYKNSNSNKDIRLEFLYDYIENNFMNYDLVKYAKEVENITLKKKDNLILNVDGMIATALISSFLHEFGKTETEQILNFNGLNAIFIIARTIGLCGTYIDQNRNKQGLYRQPDWSINYYE
jgi:ATP citrate (pro-S)-lyase